MDLKQCYEKRHTNTCIGAVLHSFFHSYKLFMVSFDIDMNINPTVASESLRKSILVQSFALSSNTHEGVNCMSLQ